MVVVDGKWIIDVENLDKQNEKAMHYNEILDDFDGHVLCRTGVFAHS